MSTATTTAKQKLFQIQVFHYPAEHGERWKAAVEGLPVQAEGDSREAVMAQVQQQLTAALTNGETVSLALNGAAHEPVTAPSVEFQGRAGDPNPPPISDEDLAEIIARLRARGHVGIGIFDDDPGAFELFDEIERQRDQHTLGG
ncbi:MAG: hypothetical protein HOP19_28735 [Acidobacteria bacterium]|nr:hypothetical protein [Acidobacteriota bacterium]